MPNEGKSRARDPQEPVEPISQTSSPATDEETAHPPNNFTANAILPKKRVVSSLVDDELKLPRKHHFSQATAEGTATLDTALEFSSNSCTLTVANGLVDALTPGQENLISVPNPMPLSQSQATEGQTAVVSSNHLVLDFSLISNDGELRHPTRKEAEEILSMFPTAYAVGFSPPMLVVRLREYPPKPWPISIAGLPAWFTTDNEAEPIQFGVPGRQHGILENTLPIWHPPSQSFFKVIVEAFQQDFGVSVFSVMWMGSWFLITIPNEIQPKLLPSKISGLLATYSYPGATGNHQLQQAAYRAVVPTQTVRGETDYQPILRPGVMVSCGTAGNNELFTTAGVPVKDQDGKKWVTVTTHGFPLGEEKVWHPTAAGAVIGEVRVILEDTDISLVELLDEFFFEAETFGTATNPAVSLVGFKSSDDVRIGEKVVMDSPFSGRREGLVGRVEFRRAGPESPDHALHWVTTVWTYIGNGSDELAAGSCGSVLWNEDGEVVAIFGYADENGWAPGLSAVSLLDAGFEICPITRKAGQEGSAHEG